ncbi:MAG: glutathione synthase [Betaproteobacteria bacterium]|nr:glutathione synthase [Betaproteobacteria bacterium]NBY14318.1 glutathione synthase [Betaproteobacteria bacterium]
MVWLPASPCWQPLESSRPHIPLPIGRPSPVARLLFVCDALETFKPHKDSTLAMMRAAQTRGHSIWVAEPCGLIADWAEGRRRQLLGPHLVIHAAQIRIQEASERRDGRWWQVLEDGHFDHGTFDAVLMRKDPPFDVDYLVATQMLDLLERAGMPVFNRPVALRDHGEKLAVLEFSDFAPEGIVSAHMERLSAFAKDHARVVFKPLDAMGGAGIFLSHASDPNLPVILETLTDHGRRQIMAQRWVPEISQGDKRILIIDGEPLPYALARIPPEGASRGNLAAGGRGEARPLTSRDLEIARALGPELADRGLFLVGLDVIGDYLTEINVTSPTGFVEIEQQTGFAVADHFIERLEVHLV